MAVGRRAFGMAATGSVVRLLLGWSLQAIRPLRHGPAVTKVSLGYRHPIMYHAPPVAKPLA